MTQNRFYSSTALPTTLAAPITSSTATSISVNSTSGNPSSFPYTMLIDWGLPTQEAVSVTAVSGSGPYSLTVTRGIDGTVAQTHVNGAIVVCGVTAEDYNEPQVHIATGTSSGSYPGVIHGLESGSSVVGTTDTQTLTNKTLGATALTGALTASFSSASGGLIVLTNTHSSPSAANVQWVAAGNADSMLAILVSGDTDNRFQVNSAGKLQWGPGGVTAVDTDLYRASAGVLETDGSLTVGSALTAGTLASGSGALSEGSSEGEVLQVTNTTSDPANPNFIVWSDGATDPAMSARVIADTHSRLHILADGNISWGTGSASTDTDLYRSAAGILSTDDTFTATEGLQVGSTSTAFAGGVGVIGVTNAGTLPSSTPSGGAVAYAKNGFMKYRAVDGLDYNTGFNTSYLTSPFTNTSTSSHVAVTGLSASIGEEAYTFFAYLLFSQASTAGTVEFSVNGPSTSTLAYTVEQYLGTTLTLGNETSYNSGPTSGTLSASTTYVAFIYGMLVASATGTLGVTVDQSASGTLSVLAGSYFTVQAIV